MQTWLMKSEPAEASIDDLQAAGQLPWTGVRNYQARNFMRDAMQCGDPPSPYFDAKSRPEAPRWWMVDVRFVAKTALLSLARLRAEAQLASMQLLQRGNRLSITPVGEAEWTILAELLGVAPGMPA